MICKDMNLKDSIQKLIGLSDKSWAQYNLTKDPLYKKMNKRDKERVIRSSINCAEEECDKVLKKYGEMSAEKYAEKMGVSIVEENREIEAVFLYFSLYNNDPPTITFSQKVLECINTTIEDAELEDLRDMCDLKEIAVAHEIFHHIEAITPNISTKNNNIEILRLGKIKYKACLITSSEIAAVHFSKLVTGLKFSPAIFEVLLMYSQNRERAFEIVDNLIKFEEGYNV